MISLLLILILGFVLDSCNNKDIIFILGYNYNIPYTQFIGGDFNLAVWRFFVCPPNLNNPNIVLICTAATAFCQIKVSPTTIIDQFAKYLTRQYVYLYGIVHTITLS